MSLIALQKYTLLFASKMHVHEIRLDIINRNILMVCDLSHYLVSNSKVIFIRRADFTKNVSGVS